MVNQSPREHRPAPDERPEILSDERPDGALGRLLDAAAAPAEAGPQPGEERALAAFRASRRTRRIPMFSHPTRTKAAVAATIGAGTLLFAGVGGAAAGVLPDPAQDTASTVLGELGFDVPRANEQAGDHPTQRGAEEDADETEDATVGTETDAAESDDAQTDSTDDATGTEDASAPADPNANDHGQAVSDLAKSTDAEGSDKGKAVSGLASENSHAGEDQGKPEQPGAQAGEHQPAAGDDDAAEDSPAGTDDGTEDAEDQDSDGSDQGPTALRPPTRRAASTATPTPSRPVRNP
jgi:hypothetical protein